MALNLPFKFIIFLFLGTFTTLGLFAAKPQEIFVSVASDVKVRAVFMENKTPQKQPKVVLVYLPGRASFFEKGKDFLEILAGQSPFIDRAGMIQSPFPKLNADVWCMEYRAHGKSGGRLPATGYQRGHITDFKIYMEDLHHILTQTIYPRYPRDTRFIFIGLSMGGQLALQYMQTYPQDPIEQMILMAPMLLFKTDPWPIGMAKNMACLLNALGYGESYAIGYGDYDPKAQRFMRWKTHHSIEAFTQDTTLLLNHPELRTGGPTFAWVCAAFKAMASTMDPQKLKRISVPVTFITASDDATVDNSTIRKAKDMIPQAKVLNLPGAWHNLIRESDTHRVPIFKEIAAAITAPQETK